MGREGRMEKEGSRRRGEVRKVRRRRGRRRGLDAPSR